MPTLPTTPERELREQLLKLLPSKDCDVCDGIGGWMSNTFTTAGMKWVVCDKCKGLPETELVDSIMGLFTAQATELLGEVEKLKIKNACPKCGSGGNEEIDPGVIDCHFCGVVEIGEEHCQYNQALDDVKKLLTSLTSE